MPALLDGEIAVATDSKELVFGASGNIQTLNIEPWQSGRNYSVGTQKVYKNNLYLCVVNHTSGTSFAINYVTNGYWIQLGFPIGGFCLHENNLTLNGFLRANGSAISRTTYDVLFAIKGIAAPYGAGDGATTFNLPNISTSINIGGNNKLYYYVKI
jgi:hypothetical protein